jgi:hypothetical protein
VIVLDTNVISELTRQAPEPGVISWLDSLPAAELATTVISAAELLYGVARLPSGHRKAPIFTQRIVTTAVSSPWPVA